MNCLAVEREVRVKSSPMVMHKQIVTRVLLLLMVLSLGLAVGCKKNPQVEAQKHLKKAQEEAAQGKTSEAIVEYRRAIQNNPKLPQAHLALGKLFLQNKELQNAFKQFAIATKLDPNNADARLSAAEMILMMNNEAGFTEAKQEADTVLAQDPNNVRALLVSAQSARGLGDAIGARKLVDQVLKLQPTNSSAWFFLSGLQYQQKDYQDAEKSVRESLQYGSVDDPNGLGVRPMVALTTLLIQQNRIPEAEKVLRDELARSPNNVQINYILASFLLRKKQLPEAEGLLRKVSQLGDKEPNFRNALAIFYVITNRREDALKEYQNILAKHPDDLLNQRQLAALYIDTGKTDEGEKVIESILKDHSNDAQTLVMRGQLRGNQGRIDEALSDLERATKADPKVALAHYYLAIAQLRKGQANLAQAELQTTLELNPNFNDARVLLANLQVRSGNADKALTNLDKVVASKPTAVNPYVMKSLVEAETTGDLNQAEKELNPLLNSFQQAPQQTVTLRALAWVKMQQKKYGEARKDLERALTLQPTDRETLYMLGQTYLAERKPDECLAAMQKALQKNPQWADGYEVAGMLMGLSGRFPQSEQFIQKAIELNPKSPSPYMTRGEVLSGEGKIDPAIESFNKVIELQPKFAPAFLRIGMLEERRGNWSLAQTNYKKALELSPDNVVAKNNLAWNYAEHGGNIDMALKLAQEAKEAVPDDPSISDTLGWIYVKKQILGNAIELLKQSVDKRPQNPEYRYHLAVAYFRAGRTAEAKQSLQTALKLQPSLAQSAETKQMLDQLN